MEAHNEFARRWLADGAAASIGPPLAFAKRVDQATYWHDRLQRVATQRNTRRVEHSSGGCPSLQLGLGWRSARCEVKLARASHTDWGARWIGGFAAGGRAQHPQAAVDMLVLR
jgi:hypothetical protein